MSHAHKILLVDDDAAFRNRLAKALKRRGLSCFEAKDHAEALELGQRKFPTHAIIDLRMPGKDGLAVVKDLRAVLPALRIVVLTGFGSIASAVEAIRLGAAHYLTKPTDCDEILKVLFSEGPEPALQADGDVPSLARVEWEHINRVLQECGGNVSKTARLLGLHRKSLQRKLAKFPSAR